LGLFGLRVDGRFGVRRWLQGFCLDNGDRYLLSTAFMLVTLGFCLDNGDRYLLSTAFMLVTFRLRFNNLNTQPGFFK
jgi:hypothetical protein